MFRIITQCLVLVAVTVRSSQFGCKKGKVTKSCRIDLKGFGCTGETADCFLVLTSFSLWEMW